MADIRTVKDISGLISYFSENLGWDIDLDDFDDIEDISYDFEASDIGLKEESFAKISSLRQLQPMVDGQQWGIFCVEFDSNRFEPSALKKILSGLIPRKRNSADHAVWCQQDLLFICNWGTDNNSTIGLAHFEDRKGGLPQIKMFSCAPSLEDFTQIHQFEERLAQLRWPKNTSNIEEWRDTWSSAFTTVYKQTIQDSSKLTVQLAAEAQNIRNRILDILSVETRNGYVHLLYDKFKATLIHDMTETQFADMYAQTVVYGLFSARCMDGTQDDFSAAEAVECIPNTNPFLKSLMKECLGAESTSKLSFDELEIGNVVDLLLHTNTETIIQDFNRQTGGGREDPVIHFYEEFLTAYDKAQKVQRGVYYTPQPVVNFIVRAVDDILKTEFGYEDGLATTATKKVKVKKQSKRKVDGLYHEVEEVEEVPAVQILDPATGTGTFPRQIILQIYENFKQKNAKLSEKEFSEEWNHYVDKHLLPRLNAFELMMAPYAVAHMKLAMVLKDTGYKFKGDSRLNVFLTNSLEEAGSSETQFSLFDEDPLSLESVEANKVKKNSGINVVIGNPPYNVSSSNCYPWMMKLIGEYKRNLNEKKINLDDDYIKFIRYAEEIITNNESGILAYISNNSFLDGVTHREMRRHLMESFGKIYIINLHGNVRKKETCPDGNKDENVFDIMQGVSINIFVRNQHVRKCQVYSTDLYGLRAIKYLDLSDKHIADIGLKEIEPVEPYYFFTPKNLKQTIDNTDDISITELFNLYNSGIQTKRDKLAVSFDKCRVSDIVSDFRALTATELLGKYELPDDERGWSIYKAQEDLINNEPSIVNYIYRPFDIRFTAYTGQSGGFMGRSRSVVMKHFLKDNLGIMTTRSHSAPTFQHVLVTNMISDLHSVSDQSYVFPLYCYQDKCSIDRSLRTPNFNTESVNKLLSKTYYEYNSSEQMAEQIFSYIYGILHSPSYRNKYAEYLKIEFPKIPIAESNDEYERVSKLGKKLIDLHLMNFIPEVEVKFKGDDRKISKIAYKDNCIFINKTSYFAYVPYELWQFMVGSYQPIQHWLKDRKNVVMTDQDIFHIKNTIAVIKATIQIMQQIG